MAREKKNEEIAVVESTSALDALDDGLAQETQGFNPQTVHIKVVHAEGLFKVGSLEPVKRIQGVVLASRMVRVCFPKWGNEAITKQIAALCNRRPFCKSNNYMHGELIELDWENVDNEAAIALKQQIATGAGSCTKCPLDEWGSVGLLGKAGNGKACAELRRLLVWQKDMTIPAILSVPTSSVRNWDSYCSALQIAGKRHNQVVTEVSAEVIRGDGQNYSVIQFSRESNLTEELAQQLISNVFFRGAQVPLYKGLISIFTGVELSEEDYPTNGHGVEDDL